MANPLEQRQKVALAVFSLMAITFILVAVLASKHRTISEVLLNIGVSIGSVVVISTLWRFVGAIAQLQQLSGAATRITAAGVIGIHEERVLGQDRRLKEFVERAAGAKQIDLLGLTLWNNWFDHAPLREALQNVLQAQGTVRIVLLNPVKNLPAYAVRLRQPGESRAPHLLDGLLESTYFQLNRVICSLNGVERERLFVRHPTTAMMYQTIIRVDDYMFVSPYVACVVGDHGFGLELLSDHTLFKLYEEEFDTMFREAAVTDLSLIPGSQGAAEDD